MSTLSKKQLVSILVLVLLVLSAAYFTEARELELNYPSIPGPNGPLTLDINTSLPDLIVYLYTFFLSIAGLIAFGSFVFAGFLFMTSGANPGLRSQAQNRIRQAVLGLALLLGTYILLSIINPELVLLHEPGVRADLTQQESIQEPPSPLSRMTLEYLGGPNFEFRYVINPQASGRVDCDLQAGRLTGKYFGKPGDDHTFPTRFLEPLLTLGDPQRYTLTCFDEGSRTAVGSASIIEPEVPACQAAGSRCTTATASECCSGICGVPSGPRLLPVCAP